MNLHKLMQQDRLTPEMIKNATADELNYQDAKDGYLYKMLYIVKNLNL